MPLTEPDPPAWIEMGKTVLLDRDGTPWQMLEPNQFFEPGISTGVTWGFLQRHRAPLERMSVPASAG